MSNNKEQNNSNQNGNSSTFHQDGNEHRHEHFTLEASGTQPYDHDRMRGKPSNPNEETNDKLSR